MSESKHTPGPWLDWETKEWLVEPKKLLANYEDAYLMAAAPELLEALEGLIDASGHMSPFGSESSVKNVRLAGKYMRALDNARAAIAKAKGGE